MSITGDGLWVETEVDVQNYELEAVQQSLGQSRGIAVWFSEEALEHWEHANDEVKADRPAGVAVARFLALRALRMQSIPLK